MARGNGTVSNQSGIEEGKPYRNGFGDASPTSCPCLCLCPCWVWGRFSLREGDDVQVLANIALVA